MTMYIVPHSGIELVDWSIDRGHPTPVSKRKDSNETLYFVYYSHGIKPDKPWQFYLDFKVQVNEMLCLRIRVPNFISSRSSLQTHINLMCATHK